MATGGHISRTDLQEGQAVGTPIGEDQVGVGFVRGRVLGVGLDLDGANSGGATGVTDHTLVVIFTYRVTGHMVNETAVLHMVLGGRQVDTQ